MAALGLRPSNQGDLELMIDAPSRAKRKVADLAWSG